jgi:hypothetical protein
VDEQALEHHFDVVRLAEDTVELGAAPPGADDGEIAGAGIAEALAVEDERHARHEIRLADDELAALLDEDDGCVGQVPLPAVLPTFWVARTKRCKDAASRS